MSSTGPEESARLMVYAARQFDSITRNAPPRLFAGKRPKGKLRAQLRIFQALPGIGPESAHRRPERFGSVEAILAATAEDLMGVPGVGRGRAEAILWAVGEMPSHYMPSDDPIL